MKIGGKSKLALQYLSVGDDNGTVFVLQIPKRLLKPLKNEVH
jgi:hypothetical protein